MSDSPGEVPRVAGRALFGGDPSGYDAARPEYPGRVIEILRDREALHPGAEVLEIGAGTGIATRAIARAGVDRILAVEPDAALAEHLEAAWSEPVRLDVVVRAFEDLELRDRSFDLAIAATSFHWIDPAVGLAKVVRVLRPSGLWAMFWNAFSDPDREDPFHEATVHLLGELESSPSHRTDRRGSVLDAEEWLQQLARAGFVDVESEMLAWTLVLDPVGVRALYATYSQINRLDAAPRAEVLDALARVATEEFSGRVERNMTTAVYTARPGIVRT